MRKVVVIGANGQLGTDVVAAFTTAGDEVCGLCHSHIEIAEFNSVRNVLAGIRPEIIINTAAMHDVESCETHPEQAYAVNGAGAKHLALIAQEMGAVIMHVSTDYVFDGAKAAPYEEDDPPRPLNVYGNTKLSGEQFIQSIADRHFVLRTSAVYGRSPCRAKGGRNFVELMLKLAADGREIRVVASEHVTPTSTRELARQIVLLSRSDAYGLYHATPEGSCSWHAFAREIFNITNTKVNLQVAGPHEFPAKVPRPEYSVLENRALKACGLSAFQPWQAGLRLYLRDRTAA